VTLSIQYNRKRENKDLTKLEITEMSEDAGWRAGMATNCLALLR